MFRFVEHIGTVVVDALSPLWTAWKRLTGRRTVDLGFLFLATYFVARVYQGSYIVPPVISVLFGSHLHVVRSSKRDSEVLDARLAASRSYMLWIVGFGFLITICFDVPGVVLTHRDTSEPLAYMCSWLALAAGAADDGTGGKTIWSEALDQLRSLVPLPSPA